MLEKLTYVKRKELEEKYLSSPIVEFSSWGIFIFWKKNIYLYKPSY